MPTNEWRSMDVRADPSEVVEKMGEAALVDDLEHGIRMFLDAEQEACYAYDPDRGVVAGTEMNGRRVGVHYSTGKEPGYDPKTFRNLNLVYLSYGMGEVENPIRREDDPVKLRSEEHGVRIRMSDDELYVEAGREAMDIFAALDEVPGLEPVDYTLQ